MLLSSAQAADLQAEIKFLRDYSHKTYDLGRSEGQAVVDAANGELTRLFSEADAQYKARIEEQKKARSDLLKATAISAGAGFLLGGVVLILLIP